MHETRNHRRFGFWLAPRKLRVFVFPILIVDLKGKIKVEARSATGVSGVK